MASKVRSLCMAALLVLVLLLLTTAKTVTHAARPVPSTSDVNPLQIQHEGIEAEESCEGVGEEECLMRRTLQAHTDYIYTQKSNP